MDQDVNRSALEVLFSVSRELATTLDLHKVLARILLITTQNLGAERASLVVLDENGKPVDAAILYDGKLAPHSVTQMQDVVASGLAGWVIQHKEAALIEDTSKDQRWLMRPGEENDPESAHSALCVPLMARQKLVGVLTIVHPQTNFFTNQQFKLQQAIADLAGIAVRNAQLYADVESAGRRYHDLFENSIDPIFITLFNGQITEVNHQAALTIGMDKPRLVKMSIEDLHEIDLEKTGKNFSLLKEGSSVTYEAKLQCADCGMISVEVHVSSIHIAGEPRLQWIFRDIRERKMMEDLREDLSAMIYHDLRSPLANVISSLDILRSMLPEDNPSTLQLVDIAQRSSERLQRLISSLLDVHRLESGQQILQKVPVNISQLIDESVDIVTPAAISRQIAVEKEFLGVPGEVNGDVEMLRRVVVNLLENAIKFSPQRTAVTIAAKRSPREVKVWVEDRGPGIPADQVDHVFTKFVRLKSEGIAKGFGIGLAFCRLAIQAHGGAIWVENAADGGSRFIFTLPVTG
jgi:PAS domain S-box-containing protein